MKRGPSGRDDAKRSLATPDARPMTPRAMIRNCNCNCNKSHHRNRQRRPNSGGPSAQSEAPGAHAPRRHSQGLPTTRRHTQERPQTGRAKRPLRSTQGSSPHGTRRGRPGDTGREPRMRGMAAQHAARMREWSNSCTCAVLFVLCCTVLPERPRWAGVARARRRSRSGE